MERSKTDLGLIHRYAIYLEITDSKRLRQLGDDLLEKCDYTVLNFMEHHFSPIGYTCIWLLGESHLAIHSFPEKNICYLELSSCSEAKNQRFKVLLEANLSPMDQ